MMTLELQTERGVMNDFRAMDLRENWLPEWIKCKSKIFTFHAVRGIGKKAFAPLPPHLRFIWNHLRNMRLESDWMNPGNMSHARTVSTYCHFESADNSWVVRSKNQISSESRFQTSCSHRIRLWMCLVPARCAWQNMYIYSMPDSIVITHMRFLEVVPVCKCMLWRPIPHSFRA